MAYLNLEKTLLAGRYIVRERLRHGSYAELFIAFDKQTEWHVVIKALNSELKGTLERELEGRLRVYFEMEGAVLGRLHHPNIIRFFGQGSATDAQGRLFHYLVLEFMPGGDLMRLCRSRRLTIDEATDYCRQACQALAYAHAGSVIHRDIKPQNILLTEDLRSAKVSDFGIAKVLRDEVDGEVTRGIGTETYAPPECYSSVPMELTPSADIYGLAKSYYVALTGESPRQFNQRPITTFPQWFSANPVANELLSVLERATQSHPHDRYQSIQEFWDEIAKNTGAEKTLDLGGDEETQVSSSSTLAISGSQRLPEQLGISSRIEIPLGSSSPEVVTVEALPSLPEEAPIVSEVEHRGLIAGAASLRGSGHGLTRRLFTIALCGTFFGVAWGVWSLAHRLRGPEGIVSARNLNLRAGPGEVYESIATIPGGSRVRLLGRSADTAWVEVEVVYWNGDQGEKNQGWVRERFVDWSRGERR